MSVIVAKTSGFCFGVKRAVSICEKAAAEHGACVTLGPIIHNEQVISDLEQKGVSSISQVSDVKPENTVIIRTHGAGPKEYEALEAIGANILDATCPDVRKIHGIVGREYDGGRLPIIIGDRKHPEVVAISGWCGDSEIFETKGEFALWLKKGDNAKKPLSVVFQTTSRRDIYNEILDITKKECTNCKVFDTICEATGKRQQEAMELSKIADVMVVVGGKNSANSLRLVDICKEHCRKVFFVERAVELDCADFSEDDTIGITAGASTPAWIIKEVSQKMSDEVKMEDNVQSTVYSVQTDEGPDEQISDEQLTISDEQLAINDERLTINDEQLTINDERLTINDEGDNDVQLPEFAGEEVADVVLDVPVEEISDEQLTVNDEGEDSAELPRPVEEDVGDLALDVPIPDDAASEDAASEDADSEDASADESFEEMLEKSIKTLHTGQKVTGIVTSITATEVSVDLGTKQSGYIPITEFIDEENTNIEDIVKIGDTIESFVMRVNDVEGMVMLSKKRLDAIKNWDEIEAAKESRTIVEGVVTEENKGGIVVNIKGVRVFVPASQSGLPKTASMSELLKKTVRLRITEVNQSRRRVVGSIRAVSNEERREKSDRIWVDIEVGKQYDGVVKSMTSYGVFVDIGGVDGMIHISELSWTRIKHPSEVMAIGDEVSVYILSLDKETRKISLGYKKNEENPWEKFTTQYSVGDVANVKIVKMMPFGAFAEICPGVDGLIHISQITDHRIALPSEVLSDGQMVDVKITEIDLNRKKISLSIRALFEPAPRRAFEKEEPKDVVIDNTPVIVYDTDASPEEKAMFTDFNDETIDEPQAESIPQTKAEEQNEIVDEVLTINDEVKDEADVETAGEEKSAVPVAEEAEESEPGEDEQEPKKDAEE